MVLRVCATVFNLDSCKFSDETKEWKKGMRGIQFVDKNTGGNSKLFVNFCAYVVYNLFHDPSRPTIELKYFVGKFNRFPSF
jgi:hypothetical protein